MSALTATFTLEEAFALALARCDYLPKREAVTKYRSTDPDTSVDAADLSNSNRQNDARRALRALYAIGHPAPDSQVAEVMAATMGHAGEARALRKSRIMTDLREVRFLVRVGRENGEMLSWFPDDPAHPAVADPDPEPDWDDGDPSNIVSVRLPWGDAE